MAIVFRPKHPDAANKATEYSNIAARLRAGRTALRGNITVARGIRAGDYESTSLNGDYYDQYVNKKDDWITQFNQIAASFVVGNRRYVFRERSASGQSSAPVQSGRKANKNR